jgi:hypothetical protein
MDSWLAAARSTPSLGVFYSHMLIDHPALSPLSPHMRTYALKGLQELQAVGSIFVASGIEIYAAAVYERVGELDNCLESMRIAIS